MTTQNEIIEEASRLAGEGVSVTLPVNGRSMLPFIVGGRDSVVLQKPGRPKTGDVVLAWVDGCRYVVHRIIRTDGERITLMGDGNVSSTEHCTAADIRARVTHTVDASGKVRYIYTRRRRWMAGMWRRLLPVRRYMLAAFRIYNQYNWHTIKPKTL